jgi:SulP family sulfate permease
VKVASSHSTSFTWRLYIPKLISVLREGYDLKIFGKDAMAGSTIAIVALSLAID